MQAVATRGGSGAVFKSQFQQTITAQAALVAARHVHCLRGRQSYTTALTLRDVTHRARKGSTAAWTEFVR